MILKLLQYNIKSYFKRKYILDLSINFVTKLFIFAN